MMQTWNETIIHIHVDQFPIHLDRKSTVYRRQDNKGWFREHKCMRIANSDTLDKIVQTNALNIFRFSVRCSKQKVLFFEKYHSRVQRPEARKRAKLMIEFKIVLQFIWNHPSYRNPLFECFFSLAKLRIVGIHFNPEFQIRMKRQNNMGLTHFLIRFALFIMQIEMRLCSYYPHSFCILISYSSWHDSCVSYHLFPFTYVKF